MLNKNSTKFSRSISKLVMLSILYFFSNFYSVAVRAQEKPGIFYAITGNGLSDTSWLFGTYHLVNSGYLDQIPAVNGALQRSKGLVVEIVMDSSKLASAQSMGLLTGKTLSEMLDKPFADSLDNELKAAIGVGISQLDQLKPVNVTLTLSIMYLLKNNNAQLQKYTGQPLDMHFTKEASAQGKNITALETIEMQMDLLFNKIPLAEQVTQLQSFIRNKNSMISLGDELLSSWFAHDLTNLYSVYDKTLRLSGEEDHLIKDRNENWMKKLPKLVQQEPQFIAVGALHLAGPDGLVLQLRQAGFTVSPVKL